jgi:PAS domain-containing protein
VLYLELIHPEDRPIYQKWQEDLTVGRTVELEYRVRHSDGSWRGVLDRAHGVRDDSGKLVLGKCG